MLGLCGHLASPLRLTFQIESSTDHQGREVASLGEWHSKAQNVCSD